MTYEVSDPTVNSQIVTLKDSGANVFFSATTNKVAAQAIRKTYDIDWHPTQFLVNNASSIATVLTPAGLDKSVGIISTAYIKDPSDPQFANDPGIAWYREFMAKYYPQGDINDPQNEIGISIAQTWVQVLKQAGNDLTRENIRKQAANIHDLQLPLLLAGHQAQHQSDQLLSSHAAAIDQVRRQELGPLRRRAERLVTATAAESDAAMV